VKHRNPLPLGRGGCQQEIATQDGPLAKILSLASVGSDESERSRDETSNELDILSEINTSNIYYELDEPPVEKE
jgi:hypothetical protein